MQPALMTSQQFAEDLIANSCKIATVYDKSTLNDVFVDGVNAFVHHSLRDYWALHPHPDLTNIALHADSFLAI